MTTHPGTGSPSSQTGSPQFGSPQDVMRYWTQYIRKPLDSGQTPEAGTLQVFEQQLDMFLQNIGGSSVRA